MLDGFGAGLTELSPLTLWFSTARTGFRFRGSEVRILPSAPGSRRTGFPTKQFSRPDEKLWKHLNRYRDAQ